MVKVISKKEQRKKKRDRVFRDVKTGKVSGITRGGKTFLGIGPEDKLPRSIERTEEREKKLKETEVEEEKKTIQVGKPAEREVGQIEKTFEGGAGLLERGKELLGELSEATDIEALTGEQINQGIIPIGPAGGLEVAKTLITKGKGIASVAKNTITIAGKQVKRFPVNNKEMIAYGKQVVKQSKSGKLGTFGVGGRILATAWAVNEFVLSPTELATWAAVDNIAGVTGFQVKNIVDGVQFTGGDIATAEERIAEAKESVANARSYVNLATMLNPKMWATRKLMLGAIDTSEVGILDQEIRLKTLKGGD